MFFHKYKRQIIIILAAVLAACMLLPTLVQIFTFTASAASAAELAEIRKGIGAQLDAVGAELDGLEGEAAAINAQMDTLMGMLDENKNQTRNVIDQKYDLDQQVDLLRQQVENTNEQIQQYNKLIAARQEELDLAVAEEETQFEQYKKRIRAMEESGDITYLSIIFDASSFSDLLDRVDMIREITESDQRLMEQMKQARLEVEAAQAALEDVKQELNEKKQQLALQETELENKRYEANAMIIGLNEQADGYEAEYAVFEEEEAKMQDLILEMVAEFEAIQAEYNAALAEEKRARAEEEAIARAKREAEASTKISSTSGDAAYYTEFSASAATESGFLNPLPAGTWVITDGFGPRTHPITGAYSDHKGVDLAANSGTNVYASKSGTVVTAAVSSAYGNYVVISHGSGQATLYAHLSSMNVVSGDYVVQGQTIGYVGSTGWSTGPHLHFEVMIDSEYYNPMNYIG